MVRLLPLLITTILLLLVSTGVTLATPPVSPDDVIWSREIASPGDQNVFSIIPVSGGGYALAGFENRSGAETGLLLKTDAGGYRSWSRSYESGQLAELYDLRQTADGGYLLAGFTLPESADMGFTPDGLAVKTDSSGAKEWMKTFGGAGLDIFTAVMADGNEYTFAGLNTSGASSELRSYMVITDLNGNVLYEFGHGEDGRNVQCYDAKRAPDGSSILAGSFGRAGVYGQDRPYMARISDSGEALWQKTLLGYGDNYAESVAIVDGGYVMAGTIDNDAGNSSYDFYLAKLDMNGNLLWNRSYGGPQEERAKCVISTPDGGYLLVGLRGPEDGNTSAYVVKTDSAGELEWDRSFEDSGKDIRLYRAVMAPDGGYVLAGYVSTAANGDDAWLVKLRGEPGYGSATTAPTPRDPGCCCAPLLVLPLLLIGTLYAAVRRQ
ncbi:hypothetical protein [Methanocella sp. MCL-LM]|uniref:hypothetical protein n=1 Tax=Methanocella sp. MCL-LM TaxID=3412035 RepID=UPI003C72C2C3